MDDVVVALGLVLVIEGLLWAASPKLARRLLEAVASTSEPAVRVSGIVAMAAGVALVWVMRGR
jgi:uncharacterized protein